jgi:hypothetical protein
MAGTVTLELVHVPGVRARAPEVAGDNCDASEGEAGDKNGNEHMLFIGCYRCFIADIATIRELPTRAPTVPVLGAEAFVTISRCSPLCKHKLQRWQSQRIELAGASPPAPAKRTEVLCSPLHPFSSHRAYEPAL